MKIMYSKLAFASLLFFGNSLFCMQERSLSFPSFPQDGPLASDYYDFNQFVDEYIPDDAASQSGVPQARRSRGPITLEMARVKYGHEASTAESDVENQTEMFFALIPSNNSEQIALEEAAKKKFIQSSQSPKDVHPTWKKILEIIGDNNLAQQMLILLGSENKKSELTQDIQYYLGLTQDPDLKEVFFYLKETLSKLLPHEKRKSDEFQVKKLVYEEIVNRFNGNKKEAKEFLNHVADYESDDDKLVDSQDLTTDGSDIYRSSKNKLTYSLSALDGDLGDNQVLIDSLELKDKELSKQLALLQERINKNSDHLAERIRNKHAIEEAKKIILEERKTERKYLDEKKEFLTKQIDKITHEINTAHHDIEEAIISKDKLRKANLTEQLEILQKNLLQAQKDLGTLNKNLGNFESPTKAYGLF